MRTSTIAVILSALALMTSACTADVEPESTTTVEQRITACGFQQVSSAVCDRTAVLGTCTEFRTDRMDLAEAEAVCASTDGVFKASGACARSNALLGVCPSAEKPGELRLHYYYTGEIFIDNTMPSLACTALSPESWCSAR